MTSVKGPLYLIAGGAQSASGGAQSASGGAQSASGGADQRRRRGPDALLQAALRRMEIPWPRVAYVGAASGDNPALRRRNVAVLRRAGAGLVSLAPLCGRLGSAAKAAAVIESADVVFVSGGDVEAGIRVLEERRMIPFLRAVHASGTPFIGVSAGSIMLCRGWIRWVDPGDEGSAELFPCLGLARVWCDTHGEGDAWGELRSMLALRPVGATGYGIASGSAIVVEPDGTISAFGGEVSVFRRRKAGVAQVQSLRPGAYRTVED
ncbi:MAG: Type 1 glutamine amidotransferase-like domain-containing protein [Spirochaetia bacterium]|jgi:cyanophycinase-like exopeptidase